MQYPGEEGVCPGADAVTGGWPSLILRRNRQVDGRRCVFAVEVHSEGGVKMGEGTHERRIIDISRFAAGAKGK